MLLFSVETKRYIFSLLTSLFCLPLRILWRIVCRRECLWTLLIGCEDNLRIYAVGVMYTAYACTCDRFLLVQCRRWFTLHRTVVWHHQYRVRTSLVSSSSNSRLHSSRRRLDIRRPPHRSTHRMQSSRSDLVLPLHHRRISITQYRSIRLLRNRDLHLLHHRFTSMCCCHRKLWICLVPNCEASILHRVCYLVESPVEVGGWCSALVTSEMWHESSGCSILNCTVLCSNLQITPV